MASPKQFKEFSKEHKLQKSGIYVIQAHNQKHMPIKIGFYTNLASRFRAYKNSLPFGFKILGLGLVRNATQAEHFMKRHIGPHVEYGKEWIDATYKNRIMNSWASSHQIFADKFQGDQLYTSSDIINKRKPTSYEILPERRVLGKTTPQKLELKSIPKKPPMVKPTGSFDKAGLRRSVRIAAKYK